MWTMNVDSNADLKRKTSEIIIFFYILQNLLSVTKIQGADTTEISNLIENFRWIQELWTFQETTRRFLFFG